MSDPGSRSIFKIWLRTSSFLVLNTVLFNTPSKPKLFLLFYVFIRACGIQKSCLNSIFKPSIMSTGSIISLYVADKPVEMRWHQRGSTAENVKHDSGS
jgi:hypothetical protein